MLNIKYTVEIVGDEKGEYDACKHLLESYGDKVEVLSDEPSSNKLVVEFITTTPIDSL
jgi:hypothetical protein